MCARFIVVIAEYRQSFTLVTEMDGLEAINIFSPDRLCIDNAGCRTPRHYIMSAESSTMVAGEGLHGNF